MREARCVRQWIEEIRLAAPFAYPDSLLERVVVVANELAVNAIEHNASEQGSGEFCVVIVLSSVGIDISVTDAGAKGGVPWLKPFDETAEGGRGLHVVCKLADRIVIHEAPNGYTVIASLRSQWWRRWLLRLRLLFSLGAFYPRVMTE
ncbi:hypothetical protein GCM10023324_23420 [Streptomyces youssoufiensis]